MSVSIQTYVKISSDYSYALSVKEIRRNTVVYEYNEDYAKNFILFEDAKSIPQHYIYEYLEGAIVFTIDGVRVLDFRNTEQLDVLWLFLIDGILLRGSFDVFEYSFGETNGVLKLIKKDDMISFYFDGEFRASCNFKVFLNKFIVEGEKFLKLFSLHRPNYDRMKFIDKRLELINQLKD